MHSNYLYNEKMLIYLKDKAPSYTPPNFEPKKSCMIKDKEKFLKNLLYYYVYIWLNDSKCFWYYPISYQEEKMDGFYYNSKYWEKRVLNFKDIKGYY